MDKKTWLLRSALALLLLSAVVGAPMMSERGEQTTVMKTGVHENYQGPGAATYADTLTRFPTIGITREFKGGVLQPQSLIDGLAARCQPAWDAGATVAWSFKPDPAGVASGAWKPYIDELALYVKDNSLEAKLVIVIWHEPENDIPEFFPTPAAFVQMFDTVNAWLLAVDPAIVTSHAALGYSYNKMTVAQARQWVTTATVQSIDLYSGRSFPLIMTLGTSKAFKVWKASRPAGAPWGVTERGWMATAPRYANRVRAIAAETAWLVALPPAQRPVFYIVWNTSGTENDPTLILDPTGVAAVNAMFAALAQ